MEEGKVKLVTMNWLGTLREKYESKLLDIIVSYYPNGCWLLERMIPYSPRILIGIYSNESKLNNAKKEYIEMTKVHDPHKNSYTRPNIEDDLKITHNNKELEFVSSGDCIYIVRSCRSSSLGGWSAKYIEYTTKDLFQQKYGDRVGFMGMFMQVWDDYDSVVVDDRPLQKNTFRRLK